MKTIAWITLALALLVAMGCAKDENQDIKQLADSFFNTVSADQFVEARRFLETPLRERTSAEALRNFIAATGLKGASNPQWKQLKVRQNAATLDGTILAGRENDALTIRMHLVLENNRDWRISGISRGVLIDRDNKLISVFAPDDNTAVKLAQETTRRFALDIQKGDFSEFWGAMAPKFRERFDLATFSGAFDGFVQNRTNLLPAAQLVPRFRHPPRLEANGELVMSGFFPTQPSLVAFEYHYANEGNAWLVSGITVELVPVTQQNTN